MGTPRVCYYTSLDDLTTYEKADARWNSPTMGDQSPGLAHLLHLILQLINGRAPCTDAKLTQKRPDPVVSETTLQGGIQSGNGDLNNPNTEKGDTKLGEQAEISQTSNLKEFSRYPNAHPMTWDHLSETDVAGEDRVGSSGVKSPPALPMTQLSSSAKLPQECTPILTAGSLTPSSDGPGKQEQIRAANDQSRSQFKRASRLEVKRIRQM
jgi:hypothetical protein